MSFAVYHRQDVAYIPYRTTTLDWNIDYLPFVYIDGGEQNIFYKIASSLLFGLFTREPTPTVSVIPNSVKYLRFNYFNSELEKGCIPDSVKHLHFGNDFNKYIGRGCIPDSVTHLSFGHAFNRCLKYCCIPNSVTHISFGGSFDQPLVKGYIPNSVRHITFGRSFNRALHKDHIPNSVTYLEFGYRFNQKLGVGHIPNGVTHLTFGNMFNQKLEHGHIPDGVTNLTFGLRFNQTLDKGDLPNSIINITFGLHFDQNIEHVPNSLETIRYLHCQKTTDLSNVPLNVNVIIIPHEHDITLSHTPHRVYIRSGSFDQKIIDNQMEGVYYIDTVEKDNAKYLVVHGDNYISIRAKSARK